MTKRTVDIPSERAMVIANSVRPAAGVCGERVILTKKKLRAALSHEVVQPLPLPSPEEQLSKTWPSLRPPHTHLHHPSITPPKLLPPAPSSPCTPGNRTFRNSFDRIKISIGTVQFHRGSRLSSANVNILPPPWSGGAFVPSPVR